jgi:cytochrome c peroxidase
LTTRFTILISIFIALGVVLVNACKKSGDSGNNATPINFTVPKGFPAPVYSFATNPLTEEGFALGRKLFYDGRLSKDGNFPCASCHQQFAGFATFDHDLSHGFNNQFTTRNAPALFNLVWQTQTHWDGGISNLEVQPLAPLTAPNEMAEDIGNVVKKLQQDEEYKKMFRSAFGDEEVTSQRMLFALTQFMASIVSSESKYDKVKRGQASFNSNEQAGYEIFKAKCTSCHSEPLFTDNSFRNTGIPVNPTLKDYGRMRITNKKEDSLKFKVPSLRNVYLSFPYGHDGRFVSIGQVLDHYSNGIQNSPTLDPLLKNGIPLSFNDKYYLTSFLGTLTDSVLLNDKRFGPPE